MPLRTSLLALLALIVLAVAPASASANHDTWERPSAGEAWGDAEAPEEDFDWGDDSDDSDDGEDWEDEGFGGDEEWWEDPDNIEAPLPEQPATPAPSAPKRPRRPSAPSIPAVTVKGKFVKGKRAMMRADGKAAIPRGAPKRVRQIIAAANLIVGKPYKWGGGHGRLFDSGYDCSGAVGYALIRTRLLSAPKVSGQLASYGSGGGGRWVSIYANRSHVYMEVAGLRLDTSPVGDRTGRRGVRWRPVIGRRSGFHARHPKGL
jgi:cell wall-associated NlpC family hydrolase